tara:strand:+ start:303 stop:1529 length:1227 start_codon:yes stop_codon:yes gene_type:complete
MAFNLGGFLMGASTQLVKSIEEEEERLQEEKLLKEEREYQEAEYKRRLDLTSKYEIDAEDRALKRDKQEQIEAASFYYKPEKVKEFAQLGLGALKQFNTFGAEARGLGLDPNGFVTISNNDVSAARQKLNKVADLRGIEQPKVAPTLSIDMEAFQSAREKQQLRKAALDGGLEVLLTANAIDLFEAQQAGNLKEIERIKKESSNIISLILSQEVDTTDFLFNDTRMFFKTMRDEAASDLRLEQGELDFKLDEDPTASHILDLRMISRARDRIAGVTNRASVSNIEEAMLGTQRTAETALLKIGFEKAETFMSIPDGQFSKGIFNNSDSVDGMSDVYYFKLGYDDNNRPLPLPSLEKTGNVLLQANIPEKMDVGDTVILQDQNGKIRISIYTGERTSQGSSGYLSEDSF